MAINGVFTADIDGSPIGTTWSIERVEIALSEWVLGDRPSPFLQLLLYGKPTDETTYRHRLALKVWARANAPWHPCLHPLQPIKPSLLPAEDF